MQKSLGIWLFQLFSINVKFRFITQLKLFLRKETEQHFKTLIHFHFIADFFNAI